MLQVLFKKTKNLQMKKNAVAQPFDNIYNNML